MNNLFVRKITLNRDDVISFDHYPFNIPVIQNFTELELTSPVTFLIGENGVGKSTFIEALAVALKLPAEGGTQNFNYQTNNTTSALFRYLTLNTYSLPKTKFFLRAESFYNFSSEVERIAEDNYLDLYEVYGGNLHKCSHGESFLQLVREKFTGNGLYILDEPEAALSPGRQLSLLCLIDELVKKGSQFIIATHSPILISYRDGKILDLNNNFQEINYQDTEIYSIYQMYLKDPEGMQHKLFDE